MKKITLNLFSLIALTISSPATFSETKIQNVDEQFPEKDKTYIPMQDNNFKDYAPTSLNHTRKIVLTFDDGPHPTLTPKLLDILKKHQVTATFFVLGENINEKTKPIIKRIVEEGHILASHDWQHDNKNTENEEQYTKNLTNSIKLIKSFQHNETKEIFYRFPYADYGKNPKYHHFNVMKKVSQSLFEDNCINFAFWNIDTSDWVLENTPEKIAQNIIAHLDGGKAYAYGKKAGQKDYILIPYNIDQPPGGGVVLLHDIHLKSVLGTEKFLEWATSNNVQIVPLTEASEFQYDSSKECKMKK